MKVMLSDKNSVVTLRNICLTVVVWLFTYLILQNNIYKEIYYRSISISVILLLFLLILYLNDFVKFLNTTIAYSIAAFFLYLLVFSSLVYGVITTIGTIAATLPLFIGTVITYIYLNKNLRNNRHSLIAAFLGIILILSIISLQLIILCRENPNIGRLIASNNADYTISSSIGSPYAIAEGLCLIAIGLFRLLLCRKYCVPVFIKLVLFIFACVFSVAVYEVQSTITTLILIVGTLAVLLISLFANKRKSYFSVLLIAIFIAVIVILIFKKDIGRLILNIFYEDNTVFGIRLREIGFYLVGEGASSDMLSRKELLKQSIISFWKSPLIGNVYFEGRQTGGHSQFFDNFSDYGLLGGIPYVLIFVCFQKYLKKALKNYDMFLWLPFLVMSILNPVDSYQCYLAVFFVLPMCYCFFEQYQVDKPNNGKLIATEIHTTDLKRGNCK